MGVYIRRQRAGLYTVVGIDGALWTVEQRRVSPEWGGGWAWFATNEAGDALDPLPTLRDVKEALGTWS